MHAMISLLLLSLLGAVMPALAQNAPASDHPILGIWRLEVPDTNCSETYRFRADGTTLVTSAAEISESVYTIPNEPDAEGFYRLTDRITKDNGKPDCSGNVMKPGANVTHFVRFHPSGKLFLLCAEASIEACIGPFTRVRGEEI
ncbi:hypothetical protein [Massilia arenae]|uniref:Lipocalin-like domain-containing protein n=1 Tax=Massilia arenae TaxID=2603288 RepID=A0A5C7G8L7_9BURK|nr:hypothetical protein [Massilia arenae]TXG02392.1 hypothetical protein FVD38_01275 [Massilia arenae]